MPVLSDDQLGKLTSSLAKEVEALLRDRTVEPHYTAEQAGLLLGGVTKRTVWNYVELGERSEGKEGIYPVVKLSHKVVLLPASSINRFLASRRVAA